MERLEMDLKLKRIAELRKEARSLYGVGELRDLDY